MPVKRCVLMAGAIAAILGVAIALFFVSVKHQYMHSIGDLCLFVLFLGEDTTEFPSRYDEAAFQMIKPGMNKATVVKLLGEPVTKQSVTEGGLHEVWRYSKSRSNGNFWFRIIIFKGDDQVTETQAKYFVD
jgi:outer membrane protein assembly factor BamE (lipoprotein component of BamABCDE complex)